MLFFLFRVTYVCYQVKLLNSISENLGEAMKSVQSRAEFSHQLESIVKGVEVRTSFPFYVTYTCRNGQSVCMYVCMCNSVVFASAPLVLPF